jgi:hypothetical protein
MFKTIGMPCPGITFKLINVIDNIIPFKHAVNNLHHSETGSSYIKNKLNKRKRLPKHFNPNKCPYIKLRIKTLYRDIREY